MQSILQSSVSPDPSEIILICWFAAQERFIIFIIISIIKVEQLNICVETRIFFSEFFDEVQMNSIYLRWKSCISVNVFLLSLLINLMHPIWIKN